MINVDLLKYPEQLAVRLTQMERDIKVLQDKVKKLEQS